MFPRRAITFYLLLLSTAFTLTASKCKKEECHSTIYVKNESKDSVIVGRRFKDAVGRCNIDGWTLRSGETYEKRAYKGCIEDNMPDGSTYEIYIVDPLQFAGNTVFYQCDSLEIKNKILKRFNMTLQELKSNNFTMIYR
jgi:hypothetical protein